MIKIKLPNGIELESEDPLEASKLIHHLYWREFQERTKRKEVITGIKPKRGFKSEYTRNKFRKNISEKMHEFWARKRKEKEIEGLQATYPGNMSSESKN